MNDIQERDLSPALAQALATFASALAEIAGDLKAIRHEVEAMRQQLADAPAPAAPVLAAAPPPPTGSPQFQALLRALEQAARDEPALGAGLDALRQAGTPEQEAAALAGWLARPLPGPCPDEVALAVLGWLDGHAEAARQAGLSAVAVSDLGEEEKPLLRLDGDFERCGVRSLGRVLLPPLRSLPATATSRLALALWDHAVGSFTWRDKLALAAGAPPSEEALAGLLDWLDTHPEIRAGAADALAELGVQCLDVPRQAETAFDAAPLYRPGQKGERPLRPALVLVGPDGERLLRRGRVRRFVAERPAAADFVPWELYALLDDLRQVPGPYCRLVEQKARPIDLDGVTTLLQPLVRQFTAADTQASDRIAALGRFVQEALRIGPVPAEDPRKDWASRQRELFDAARHYLGEAGFEILHATIGKSAQEYKSDFHVLGKKASGFNNGAVVEVRVAGLRHPGEGGKGGFTLKGTLYFHNPY